MKKTGNYILIILFLSLSVQSLFASVSIQPASCCVLHGDSETSATALQSGTDEFIILDIIDNDNDNDNETVLSVQKKKSKDTDIRYKNTQWSFIQFYNAPFMYQFPYLHPSSLHFIEFRVLRI